MTFRKTVKKWAYRYVPGLAGRYVYFGSRVHFPTNALMWDLLCEEGIYESDILRQIEGAMRPGTWFIDVGTNVGLMSVPILSMVPDARVLSFEPSPNTKPFLQKTWSESPYRDRWKISGSAVGDRVGEVEFCLSPARFAGLDGIRHTGRAEQVGKAVIPMTTLDEEWKTLGRPPVSCIKLDMEGAEALALAGARELIRAEKPHIFLEWYQQNLDPFGCQPGELLKYAEEFNYDTIAVPTLSVVPSLPVLLMHMHRTAAFALVPRSAKPA